MTPNDTSPNNIKRLTEIHIHRYEARIWRGQRGDGHVNLEECRIYLRIWTTIKSKQYVWEDLSAVEQTEVTDAVESGE